MPWRSNPQFYYVWVSEMMLQQTQVDTVIPYFDRFTAQFPTVYDLAKADIDVVLKCWEGLGYYSRARNLHKAAQLIVAEFNGQLPSDYDTLQTLPGLGPYCAAAIASIAFEKPVPVVDGNVLRVFTRFWGLYDNIKDTKTRNKLFSLLSEPIKQAQPSQFNQAIMELGSLVCKPKDPQCQICPLNTDCVAYKQNLTQELPQKTASKPVPHYNIAVGIIENAKGQVLIAKRPTDVMLGGLWEFPGGKQEPGELLNATLVREIFEETQLKVSAETELCVVKHAYSHFKITLHAFVCKKMSGTAKPLKSTELKWIDPQTLPDYPFPKANKTVLEKYLSKISFENK